MARHQEEEADEWVTLLFKRRLRETSKAVLFVKHDDEEVWIPKSQIDSEEEEDKTWVVTVAEWFAKKEGFIDDDD